MNDFGARYFSSSMGRWLTPDWSERPTAVPYAVFGDPQSLNLYLYVRNDPVSRADADGHIDDNADPDHMNGSCLSSFQCYEDYQQHIKDNEPSGWLSSFEAAYSTDSGNSDQQSGVYSGAVSASADGTTVAYRYAGGRIEYVTGQGHPLCDNNPGDIEYGPFARSAGAIGNDGRFAIFSTPAAGFTALDALLMPPPISATYS